MVARFIRNFGPGGLAPYYQPVDPAGADEFARRYWDPWTPRGDTPLPHTDVYEDDGSLVIETELPGMKAEDIEVKLEGDRLTVRAERKESTKDARHHTRERYYGEFYRSFTLPFPVREDGITARYQDGVLEVVLPMDVKAQAKKIEVKGQSETKRITKAVKKPEQTPKA